MSEFCRGEKFRLYPTPSQERKLARIFGATRWVFNHYLEKRKADYETSGKSNNLFDDQKDLVDLKKEENTKWLADIGAHVIRAPLENLEAAFQNFFARRAKYPKFKSKYDQQQSFKVPANFSVKKDRLFLPKMQQDGIKIVMDHELPSKPLYCHVSKNAAGEYYVSFACKIEMGPLPSSDKTIGIDLGLKSLLIMSDGTTIENPKFYQRAEKELAHLQKRYSKKQKGSKNKEKARLELAALHQYIANSRKDYLHKISRRLIDENQVIFAESLQVKNMVKNHSLAKSISDAGWGELCRQLTYKAEWYGRTFYQIDAFFPSSKTCHYCKFIWKDQTLNDREWDCPNCLAHLDRDHNASLNIRDKGLKGLQRSLVEEYQSDSKQKLVEPSCSKARRKSKTGIKGS